MQNPARTLPVLAILIAVPTASAHAQALHDRFWLEASLYRPHIDSSVAVTSKANPDIGTKIDMEKDLGLDSRQELPAFLAGARVSRKFAIVAEFFQIGREGERTIANPITFNGVTYPANAVINSNFDTDIYRLTLNYSIVRKDTIEAGIALGVHATKFDVSLEGLGSIGGQSGQTERRAEDFLAPLPTVGVFANFEVAPRLTIGGRADYMSLKVGDYDCRLINVQGKVSYRVVKNLGIGVGYRYVDYKVDVDKDRYTGNFKYSFNGPAIFLEAGF